MCSIPDDSTASGRELRLSRNISLCRRVCRISSARHQLNHASFDNLAETISIHLNDTHPVLAVPELIRILVDEQGVSFKQAWSLAQQIFSYTNHTLMSEALETWTVEMLGRILPRHLMIIFDINNEFLSMVAQKFENDNDLLRRVSLVDEAGERRVRMAYLAVVASHKAQWCVRIAFGTDERIYFCRFCTDLSGTVHECHERHYATPLAVAGQSVPV